MASTAANAQAKSKTAPTPASEKPAAKPASAKPASAKSAATKKPVDKEAVPVKAAAPAKAVSAKPVASAAKPKPAARAKAPAAAQSPKAKSEHVDRIWELAKRIGVCMFVTWDGERQRSRPLQGNVDRDEHAIYFLSDVDSHKDEQVEDFPIVTLAFADIPHSKYVSITGRGTVLNDREKIKELWSPFAQAWWDNADDPGIRVIKVEPQDAELWDSPGRVVTAISMLAAAVIRRSPKIGENAKVKL